MKVFCYETSRVDLPQEPVKYIEYECPGSSPGGPFKLRSPIMQFSQKIEGKRIVDEQFVSNWVQYI